MMQENTYCTEVDTFDGVFAGPHIEATSWAEAEKILQQERMGYARVVGKVRFSFFAHDWN